MNFNHILNEIAKADPEVFERTSERRDVIRRWGKGIALTALPVALGGLFKKAYGQGTSSIVDILNFALTLEYLERDYYQGALETAGLIPTGAPTAAITNIRDHEAAHVLVLIATINELGGTPIDKPNFEFENNATFGNVYGDYPTFLAVAQAFEDTGVRAYKGQAANLITNNKVLTAALQIHSVEARHAAHIRRMRTGPGINANVKPWITGKSSGITATGAAGAAVEKVYEGEQQTTQAGINIIGIKNLKNISISTNAASEAFDEPLTMAEVVEIATVFIKP